MAKYFRSFMIQVEYPDGLLDDGDSSPTGPGVTTPLTELAKIISDGCGESFTINNYLLKRNEHDAIFVIKEV